jgi:hypothetical protein
MVYEGEHMPKGVRSTVKDSALLEAALEGLEAQKQRIDEQIRRVQAMLGKRRGRPPAKPKAAPEEKPTGRRKLSAAARKRIAAAQKRRWAEFRKRTAGASKA